MKCPKIVTRHVHGSRKPKPGPCGLAIEIRLYPLNEHEDRGPAMYSTLDIQYRCTAGHHLSSRDLPVGTPFTVTELEEWINKRLGE